MMLLTQAAGIVYVFIYAQISLVSSKQCGSLQSIPNLRNEEYSSLAEINIGAFVMTTYADDSTTCSGMYRRGSVPIELTEAIAYAVKRVNEHPTLLPNVTMGFVILNDCTSGPVALAKALQFLPRMMTSDNDNYASCTCNASLSASSSVMSPKPIASEMKYYDVVGVISPMWSGPTVLVSQLFSTIKIPLIGCVSTSDELSSKTAHPYFLRVVSPDRFQVEAMLSFIQSNGWTYIAILYEPGSFGETGYDTIKKRASAYRICIATSHNVSQESDFDLIVQDLLDYPNVSVVIVFTYIDELRSLFDSINKHKATGKQIWIGGDGWGSAFRTDFKGYEKNFLGAFWFSYKKELYPDFYRYLSHILVRNSTNPWLLPIWESLANCSFDAGTCDANATLLSVDDFTYTTSSSQYIDAVNTFAHAVTQLMLDLCPGASGSAARDCIKGDILLEYLKNVSFDGLTGRIEFDEFGDVKGQYEINQITLNYKNIPLPNITSTRGLEPRRVAVYDIKTGQIIFSGRNLSWEHLDPAIRAVSKYAPKAGVPLSVCSLPCGPGEYQTHLEVACCWVCRKCRENERLIDSNRSCEECPVFTWPDPATGYTACRVIEPEHLRLTDTLSLIQICAGIFAIICVFVVGIGYIYFRDSRVIKAASKELSILQMAAVIVGYLTVILFQFPPSHEVCGALYFLFCLSFAWLYAPLIVKALRVYRIFLSGSKHNMKPRFVSPKSQIVITGILISVQVAICVIVYIMYNPTVKKTQSVRTEMYVELSCDMTLPGLASFLAYNLVLVSCCSLIAFKTRQLPDNFNESWFMFMCVSTTLVIWLAFIPTYFTASREFVRILLLSVSLLLNHTVAVVFLFLPKIYAALQFSCNVSRFQTNNAGSLSLSPPPCASNRIAPASLPQNESSHSTVLPEK